MNNLFAFIVNDFEEEERRAVLKRERLFLRDRSDAWNLPDRESIKMFRLNKELCEILITGVTPFMDIGRRNTKVSIDVRVLSGLRFFVTGSYQKCIGSHYNIALAQQTVSKYLTEVATAIERLAEHWIIFPTTEIDKNSTKVQFMQKFQFPGVVGVIDGIHVAILRPTEHEHLYFNRKGFHSKNVQIVCNSDLHILNVNAAYGGATHDAFIWNMSNLKRVMGRTFRSGAQRSCGCLVIVDIL